jgi:hypothetical protein
METLKSSLVAGDAERVVTGGSRREKVERGG